MILEFSKSLNYLLLCLAVVSVSSAATAFRFLDGIIPTVILAWRIQVTCIAQFLPFLIQIYLVKTKMKKQQQPQSIKAPFNAKTWHWSLISTILLQLVCGIILSLHYIFWISALQNTSLAHAVILTQQVPIWTILLNYLRGLRVSRVQLMGVGVSLLGSILLVAGDKQSSQDVTLLGDFYAVLASLGFLFYIQIGSFLRQFVPLFIYIFPVNTATFVFSSIIAVIQDHGYFNLEQNQSVFGYTQNKVQIGAAIFLGLVPGVLGHTTFNYLVKYISPLTLSIAVNFEPIIGTIIGYSFGFQEAPSFYLYIGAVLILGAITISVYDQWKEAQLEQAKIHSDEQKQDASSSDSQYQITKSGYIKQHYQKQENQIELQALKEDNLYE